FIAFSDVNAIAAYDEIPFGARQRGVRIVLCSGEVGASSPVDRRRPWQLVATRYGLRQFSMTSS
ncbi:MAG TPA: hypothetical protein VM925_30425, partial [Labilithrix sp.]|nr:hypothetical protein [Labilithrix sp.]